MIKDPSLKLIITEWFERKFVGVILDSLSTTDFFTCGFEMFHYMADDISDVSKGF